MIAAPEKCLACGGQPVPRFLQGDTEIVGCRKCGLEWRRPFPTDVELAALYGRHYFQRWGISDLEHFDGVRAAKEATFRRFLSEIPVDVRSGRLLDIGCAFGFMLHVAREAGFDAYGLDTNTAAIDEAKREFGDRVRAGPLDQAAFPGMCFHAVTLIDVLEHVCDPVGLFRALDGRLAPGGVVLAVLPNAASLACRVLGRRWPHYVREHLFFWTPTALDYFAKRIGWHISHLRTGVRKVFTAAYLLSYARALGQWSPPGLASLGNTQISIGTGELLVVLRRTRENEVARP